MKSFIFELNTEGFQHLTVKKVCEYRGIVYKNKGESKAEEFCHYVLRVKAMYLLVISLHYASLGDTQRVLNEYEDFHQQAMTILKDTCLADIYEGDKLEGMRHGKGTMFYKGGGRYEGDWLLDAHHGTGKKVWPNGDEYQGSFTNGTRYGEGLMKWANGLVYDGEWKNDLMHGRGIATFPNGDVYTGQFLNDKKHGLGTYTTTVTGEKFDGEWSNDERLFKDDKNKEVLRDFNQKAMEFIQGVCKEDTYVGERRSWPSNAKHGKGVLLCKNSSVYFGEWYNDKKHGKGMLKKANGNIYDGDCMIQPLL